MVPKPYFSDKKLSPIFPEDDGDEIVISGIAGKFPNSKNISEFKENLYKKVDMVTDDAFKKAENMKLPNRLGKMTDMRKFDSTFFGVHYKQSVSMDPQCRMLLETSYEAVIDAGINPRALKGSNTGVFIATSYAESEKAWFYENILPGGFGITGCSRAMIANRISYVLGLQGPSFIIDTGGSGSTQALEIAYSKLRSGEIDSAIIGGTNLILFPSIDAQFQSLGTLSSDGFTRSFDENSSGYNRSETISCAFLQRKRNANRVYAYVIHCRSNHDGLNPERVLSFSKDRKQKLMCQVYNEVKVSPKDVGYVEANGTGIPSEDIQECEAIDEIFCKGRKDSLLIGTIKSNIGHADAAAGISAIMKICLASDTGKIAPNLNFVRPRQEIRSLINGHLKVVTEAEELKTPYMALNSFGYSGSNTHALFKSYQKEKINFGIPIDDLPRIVNWSSRTEEGVNVVFESIEHKKLDAELVGLIHKVQYGEIPGLVFRGYGIYSKDENENAQCLVKDVQHYSGIKRPIVWVFSGMGSQWCEMGTSLMKIDIFRDTILKCHNALLPKGLDLIKILTSTDKTIFDNILHSFVGIAAVQIALVDILKALNLEPDYIIGHSVGELGCGYADGGLTAEQMILSSYSRGKISLESEKIRGSMAAIGMGYSEIIKLLPDTIEVACHNSFESSTISGPEDDVAKFVAELKEKGVFAREVPCSNIAYHSKYIAQMGPKLLEYLSKIIPEPKSRSEKWLSSSVPKSDWDKQQHQYCSAEYHTNNLLNSVLFEETAALLPKDSIAIEIAPHGLLQAILKRSLPKAVNIGLTQRNHKDNSLYLLQALGKIFTNGIDMPFDKLYPKIEFPVSRGTQHLSSLVRWVHTESWYVSTFEKNKCDDSRDIDIKLTLQEDSFKFLYGHQIDEQVLVPGSFLIELVVDFFSKCLSIDLNDKIIELNDVRFLRQIYLENDETICLKIMIHRGSGSGSFSISEFGSEILSGCINLVEDLKASESQPSFLNEETDSILSKADIYKELQLRGHTYSDYFQCLSEMNNDAVMGKIQWKNNLTIFLDGLFQVNNLRIDSRRPMIPTRLRKMTLNMKLMYELAANNNELDFKYYSRYKRLDAGGFTIYGLECNLLNKEIKLENVLLEKTHFVPHFPTPILTTLEATRCCLQLALENFSNRNMKILELDSENEPISHVFKEALNSTPNVTGKCIFLTTKDIILPGVQVEEGMLSTHSNCTFIIASEILKYNKLTAYLNNSLAQISFVISKESLNLDHNSVVAPKGFNLLAIFTTENNYLCLLQKMQDKQKNWRAIEVSSNDTELLWLANVKTALKCGPVIVYSYNDKFSGILGMVKCLSREIRNKKIICFQIDNMKAPNFDIRNHFYAKQLELGLSVNVLKKEQWGTYRQFLLTKSNIQKNQKVCFGCNIGQIGDLNTLAWYEQQFNINECNISVVYSSINFRDVLLAVGRLTFDIIGKDRLDQRYPLGIEFSGIEASSGKRVMGLSESNALSSNIKTNSRLLWEVPKYWSLRDAATVPVAYATVYYAFFNMIKIKKGKSILIHLGAGSVGLAAIRVALAYGLEVFTTVSSTEKKKFLLEQFSELKESHVGSSCNTSFEEMIQDITSNIGVDYVLNSLSGEKLLASLRCLAKHGVFLELGKYDLANANKIGIGVFLRETSFHSISIRRFLVEGLDVQINKLKERIRNDISVGIIQPLPSIVFKPQEVEEAFRKIESHKHVGKVLIEMRENSISNQTHAVKMIEQVYFKDDLAYIVCDSFDGFGVEFVDWLVMRGARKLILCLNGNEIKSYFKFRMSIWKKYETQLVLHSAEINDITGCTSLLNSSINLLGQIGGIFVLNPTITAKKFSEQTKSDFENALRIKSNVVRHMDTISKKNCSHLKYFVVFSTISCSQGSENETSIALANSISERVIENRVDKHLPGKAIQWTPTIHSKNNLEDNEILTQKVESCLNQLDVLLCSEDAVVSSMILKKAMNTQYKELNVIESVLRIMGINDFDVLPKDAKLFEMGLSSLTAIEIRHLIEKKMKLKLPVKQLHSLTFSKLKELLLQRSDQVNATEKLKICTDSNMKGIRILMKQFKDLGNNYETFIRLSNKSTVRAAGILVIPGIEGIVGNKWYSISSKVKSTVTFLQTIKYPTADSISKLAEPFLNDVMNSLEETDKFFIIGHSFGALIALELARILEQSNYKGKILLIDGAPTFFRELLFNDLGENCTENDLLDVVLSEFVSQLYVGESIEKIIQEFKLLETKLNKMKKFSEIITNHTSYSYEYVEFIVEAIIDRLKLISNLNKSPSLMINSSITLVRPKEVSLVDIDEDYQLSKLTKGKVTIRYLDGNHATILNNPDLVQIINECDPIEEERLVFEQFLESDAYLERDFKCYINK